MSKFIQNHERDGTCYLEFQFCGTDKPLKNGRVVLKHIRHWSDNSLYIDRDDFGEFYRLYADVLDCAVLPNGERGCDDCGVNYYSAEDTEKFLAEISRVTDERYSALAPWLKAAAERGKGFYILGV